MAIGSIFPMMGSTMSPVRASEGDSDKNSVAKMAARALSKGMQDGGPVTPVKTSTDRSGATGVNDYYAALGYEA